MAKYTPEIQGWLFASEGGYVDHPKDPGGATNHGITRKVLARWRGVTPWSALPKSEVRDLSQGGARLARPSNWPGRLDGTCRIYFIFEQEIVIALDAHCLREGAEDLAFEFLPGQETRVGALLYESRFLNQEREVD